MSLKPTVRDAKVAGILLAGAGLIYAGVWGWKKIFGKKDEEESGKKDRKAS